MVSFIFYLTGLVKNDVLCSLIMFVVQRINIANEKGVNAHCIVFLTGDKDICISRCQQRTGHETLHPSKAGM